MDLLFYSITSKNWKMLYFRTHTKRNKKRYKQVYHIYIYICARARVCIY